MTTRNTFENIFLEILSVGVIRKTTMLQFALNHPAVFDELVSSNIWCFDRHMKPCETMIYRRIHMSETHLVTFNRRDLVGKMHGQLCRRFQDGKRTCCEQERPRIAHEFFVRPRFV